MDNRVTPPKRLTSPTWGPPTTMLTGPNSGRHIYVNALTLTDIDVHGCFQPLEESTMRYVWFLARKIKRQIIKICWWAIAA